MSKYPLKQKHKINIRQCGRIKYKIYRRSDYLTRILQKYERKRADCVNMTLPSFLDMYAQRIGDVVKQDKSE